MKLPTFDEWFFARYGATFDELYQRPELRVSDAISALTRETRDYLTDMVSKAHAPRSKT